MNNNEKETVLPDYNNCIVNLVTSILKNYNLQTQHNSLRKLDEILSKQYKNVILVVLDGMGNQILETLSPNGFFNTNKLDIITTVYPSTTAAAMTVYYSGKQPIETGWIGWSQYFKEYGRAIDMLPGIDSYTGEKINFSKLNMYELMKYKTIFEQIEEISKDVKVYEVKSSCADKRTDKCIHVDTIKGMKDSIVSLCKNNENKFIFAYNEMIDKTSHRNGTYSEPVQTYIDEFETEFKDMYKQLQGTDSVVIICADHGHTNINTRLSILDYPEINDCLYMPAGIEARFISFWVKPNKKEEFVKIFNEKFEDSYKLYTKKEILDMNLLGNGKAHKKIDDFLGDYLAIAISDVDLKIETNISREKYTKYSNHCGLTKNEMLVPMIVLETK